MGLLLSLEVSDRAAWLHGLLYRSPALHHWTPSCCPLGCCLVYGRVASQCFAI